MKRAVILAVAALGCVLAGAVAFSATDHVSFWLALYWAVETATTVGYGDVTPHTASAHLIAVGVMLTTIPCLGASFASLTAFHLHRHVRDHIDRALAARGPEDDKGEAP